MTAGDTVSIDLLFELFSFIFYSDCRNSGSILYFFYEKRKGLFLYRKNKEISTFSTEFSTSAPKSRLEIYGVFKVLQRLFHKQSVFDLTKKTRKTNFLSIFGIGVRQGSR